MQSQVTRSKPVILGIGVISIAALFLSLGDPGKEERQQLMTSVAESQENIHVLEEKISQQEIAYRQQAELLQQLSRKLEANEDQSARLKTKVDELEKAVIRLKQPPAPVVAKPAPAAPAKSPAKPAVTPPAKPVTKPTPR